MDKKFNSILHQSLDQIMSDRFGRYSKYIIQQRALPDVRDGLKPVQRRILFAMSELGLNWNTAYKKSARVVGEVIGKYHPHGDSSIYEAMVRMAQDWKINVPLIDMHGNKGSIDDDPAAAMRYTEARLAKISEKLIDNIKKNTVNFAPNFDDSEREPVVLPAIFPNLLVNGAKGIAAGYATEMPPHNLNEVIDAIIYRIKNPNARLSTILNFIHGPDFPTGGIVEGKAGIFEAFERGRGKILIRSKYEVNDSKTKPFIQISEIPYGVIKQKLVRDIAEIGFNKKIDGIKDVRDETDREGISIMIELQPGTNPSLVANYLLQKTEMQIYYNYNNIAILDNAPKQLNILELIDAYLKHQKEVQRFAITFDYKKNLTRLEIVEGLIKVSQITEQVIDVIRKVEGSKKGVVESLINSFGFTESQANAIADLRLYRLSRTDQNIYIEEKQKLEKEIERAKILLNNENELFNYLIELLKELKKEFGSPRKTTIVSDITKIEYNIENLIKHEDVWIGISRLGYVKVFSNRVFESNKIEEYTLKEDDSLVYLEKVNTANKLLVFTSKGRYIFMPIHKISESKWKDVGKHLNSFASILADEKIVEVVSAKDFDLNLFVVLATLQGKIKRSPLKDFEVSRFSKPLVAISLSKDDELVGVSISNELKNILLINNLGKAVRYSESDIPIYGSKSSGIKGFNLLSNSHVRSLITFDDKDVITLISKRGGIKRIKATTIPFSSKNTQGKSLYLEVKNNPHILIDGKVTSASDQVFFKDKSNNITYYVKNIEITTPEEGFSLATSNSVDDGKILSFLKADKDSIVLETDTKEMQELRFKKAEDDIDKISQISIDDIIKGIK